MAKTDTEALEPIAKSTALEPAPDYFEEGDRRGLEDMTKQDMLIPRLALAQSQSPQVIEGGPRYVPGMKVGDLFNSQTNEIYGQQVFVQIIRKDRERAMEFRPVDQGGGVIDPNVPLNDPRLLWEGDKKPVATLFRDYLALLLPSRELIAISFKSTGIKVAKQLNGLITFRRRPIFAGRYVIATALEMKPQPHRVYRVDNAGWVSKEDAMYGEGMWDAVRDMDREIDRAGVDDDSFDPDKM